MTSILSWNATTVESKVCGACGQVRPMTEYAPMKYGKGGRHSNCRECQARYAAERTLLDSVFSRRRKLRRCFDMTLSEYENLWTFQGGVCYLCHRMDKVNLCVDHDHRCCPSEVTCGECVRGLICHSCNKMLGAADDNAELLRRGAEWVRTGGTGRGTRVATPGATGRQSVSAASAERSG